MNRATGNRAPALPAIEHIHVEESSALHESRSMFLRAPNVTLREIGARDLRLAAHLDALHVACRYGCTWPQEVLSDPSAGRVFAAAVLAIEGGHQSLLDRFWEMAGEQLPVREGLLSAYRWVEPSRVLRDVKGLLQSDNPLRRATGICECAVKQVVPGMSAWMADPDPLVRAAALKTAGQLGRQDLRPDCIAALSDKACSCQFWAAWSAVLLGDSGAALDSLLTHADRRSTACGSRAFRVGFQAMSVAAIRATLDTLARDSAQLRRVVCGAGLSGDPFYVPWLLRQLTDVRMARVAGEAITFITGADLDAFQLSGPRPQDFKSGPTDDPQDEDVDLDPDDGLPWPDQQKLEAWWLHNGHRFQAGRRYFMGQPVNWKHCLHVLKTGFQRQRVMAATYLCLLRSGTPLFDTSAPAWRQQRLLAEMT